jgi:hypothetical protein
MPLPTEYTFNAIMAAIIAKTITTTSDVNIYITRYAYSQIIVNSNGQIPYTNLPVMSVNAINFSVGFFNYTPIIFSFEASDFTTATDWIVYTPPT